MLGCFSFRNNLQIREIDEADTAGCCSSHNLGPSIMAAQVRAIVNVHRKLALAADTFSDERKRTVVTSSDPPSDQLLRWQTIRRMLTSHGAD